MHGLLSHAGFVSLAVANEIVHFLVQKAEASCTINVIQLKRNLSHPPR
jgi:hypothetical protein